MFSGYDPSYNPEALERAKAESKELSEEQQNMADKWAAAMESYNVEAETAQMAAETAVAGDEVVAAEIIATGDAGIAETEPQIQQAFKNRIALEAQQIVKGSKPDEAPLTPISDRERHDPDNLVARAVAAGSGEDTINLNNIGAKLEGEGVDIKREVEAMNPDIAKDMATVGGTKLETAAEQAQAADSLAVDTGAKALALKEQAADTAKAVKHGDIDAATKVAEFTQAAAELDNLAGNATSAATMNGQEVSETIGEARTMAEEAKGIVNQAQTEAATAEAQTEDQETDHEAAENGEENKTENEGEEIPQNIFDINNSQSHQELITPDDDRKPAAA